MFIPLAWEESRFHCLSLHPLEIPDLHLILGKKTILQKSMLEQTVDDFDSSLKFAASFYLNHYPKELFNGWGCLCQWRRNQAKLFKGTSEFCFNVVGEEMNATW